MARPINVIDLFAGPGGLGEGFARSEHKSGDPAFTVRHSVECDPYAFETLKLRAFFRTFESVPTDYYYYLRGHLSLDELYRKYPKNTRLAQKETFGRPMTLGNNSDDVEIFRELKEASKRGDWVIIGGPPCQAYSLVGRSRNRGKANYVPEDDSRHFLYREYLQALSVVNPLAFVMENVKGILSSKVNGRLIFPRILEDLADPAVAVGRTRSSTRYKIYSLSTRSLFGQTGVDGSDYVIRSERYGVPQARHRVILLGLREDILSVPAVLREFNREIPVGLVLSDLPRIRSGLSRNDSPSAWQKAIQETGRELLRIVGTRSELGDHIRDCIRLSRGLNSRGNDFVPSSLTNIGATHLRAWTRDRRVQGFINHESRGHIEGDLARYMFASIFASVNDGKSPKANDFPHSLAPNHVNWRSGKFVDRFKVQSENKPGSTITSHISKDGHYFIHYDTAQVRSLTVREAARIQTFPDNYRFEGNRTQQFVQVGNAVPPWLANQIADIVKDAIC